MMESLLEFSVSVCSPRLVADGFLPVFMPSFIDCRREYFFYSPNLHDLPEGVSFGIAHQPLRDMAARGQGFILFLDQNGPDTGTTLRQNRRILEENKGLIEASRVLSLCS